MLNYTGSNRRKDNMDNAELVVMIQNTNETVHDIKKYILGNGQPGLLTRMAQIEVRFQEHCEDYKAKVESMEMLVTERKKADIKVKEALTEDNKERARVKAAEYWDLKKIIISFVLITLFGAAINFTIIEALLRPILTKAP